MTTTFEGYVLAWHAIWTLNPDQRSGQSAFNVLDTLRPDLADRVRTTPHDPFYCDVRLPGFLAWLVENW